MAKELFQSKSGKTFDDVRTLIGSDYVLKRTTHNTKKFILTDVNSKEQYFGFKATMGDMHDEISKIGLDKFLKKYAIDSVEPKAGKITPKKIAKIEKAEVREFKKEKKISKITRKQNKLLIEKLEEEKSEIVVKLLNMSLVRGSKEHKALRKKLDEKRAELAEVPGYTTFMEKSMHVSKDDLIAAKKRGEEIKKEKKARKTKIQKTVNLQA